MKLRSGIEKLFTWGQKGVDIFLVSSGPNYYVEHLAAKQNIVKEHVLCSQYIFDSKGIISKCFAIEDQDKTQFVMDHINKYDLTIGIGDSKSHDGFIDVCTIALLMEPDDHHLHVPRFDTVSTLLNRLIVMPNSLGISSKKYEELTVDDFKKLSIRDVFRRVSLGLWIVIFGIIVAAFVAGAGSDWLKGFVSRAGNADASKPYRS